MSHALHHLPLSCGGLWGRRGSSQRALHSFPLCKSITCKSRELRRSQCSPSRSRWPIFILRAASVAAEAPNRQDAAQEGAADPETDRVRSLSAEVEYLAQLTQSLQSLPSVDLQVRA
jgi:hypothetical protein